MTRVAILDDYQNVALSVADWSSLPSDTEFVVFNEHLNDEASVAALKDFPIIVAMRERTPFPATQLEKLPALRLLVTTGMRNLAIDMDAARRLSIDVCGTPILPYPAFEHTWALILALAKNIVPEDRDMRQGQWKTTLTEGLRGKTLSVLGLGKLGTQTANVGNAFGMKVIAWSKNLTPEKTDPHNVECVSRSAVFERADYLAIHLILSDRTRGLVSTNELKLMKPTAYLINTSRGPIVDEDALIEALRNKTIAGAGIDVYDIEPLPAHHPLRTLENAVLTGHTGYVMRENLEHMYGGAVEDIAAWLQGDPERLLNPAGEP